MPNKSTMEEVTLYCGHIRYYRSPIPIRGESVVCGTCREVTTVDKTRTLYNIRCADCKLSRTFGRDLTVPRSTASRHVMKRPTHTVTIYDGLSIVEEISMEGDTLPFPSLDERLIMVRGHQQSLRDFLENANVTQS